MTALATEKVSLTLSEIQTLDDPEFASRLSLYERFRLRDAVQAILRDRYVKWAAITPEALARAWWIEEVIQDSTLEWAERAWDDMGGSEPSQERAVYEVLAAAALRRIRDGRSDV